MQQCRQSRVEDVDTFWALSIKNYVCVCVSVCRLSGCLHSLFSALSENTWCDTGWKSSQHSLKAFDVRSTCGRISENQHGKVHVNFFLFFEIIIIWCYYYYHYSILLEHNACHWCGVGLQFTLSICICLPWVWATPWGQRWAAQLVTSSSEEARPLAWCGNRDERRNKKES